MWRNRQDPDRPPVNPYSSVSWAELMKLADTVEDARRIGDETLVSRALWNLQALERLVFRPEFALVIRVEN